LFESSGELGTLRVAMVREPLGFDRRAALLGADDDCGGAGLLCVHPRWSPRPGWGV